MESKTQQSLKQLTHEAALASVDMGQMEAYEFFTALADWAYANAEAMLIDSETEEESEDAE